MPSNHPLLTLLGVIVVLALGAGIGLLISKEDQASELGHSPKVISVTSGDVAVPPLPARGAIPPIRTTTVEVATDEGDYVEIESEASTERYEPPAEPYVPEPEIKEEPVKQPNPNPTPTHDVTVGPSE